MPPLEQLPPRKHHFHGVAGGSASLSPESSASPPALLDLYHPLERLLMMGKAPLVDSAPSFKQNRRTSDLVESGIQEWFPPDGKTAGVEHYFSTAAARIEAACSGQGFHFHFTANTDTVPLRGPRSVVFVMSEEHGMLPRYTRSVEAVFKCYGVKFVFDSEMVIESSLAFPFFSSQGRDRIQTEIGHSMALAA